MNQLLGWSCSSTASSPSSPTSSSSSSSSPTRSQESRFGLLELEIVTFFVIFFEIFLKISFFTIRDATCSWSRSGSATSCTRWTSSSSPNPASVRAGHHNMIMLNIIGMYFQPAPASVRAGHYNVHHRQHHHQHHHQQHHNYHLSNITQAFLAPMSAMVFCSFPNFWILE